MTACLRAGRLLERRASGLDESEKLLLDEHLSTCARCREDERALSSVRELLGEGFELDARTRARLLDKAFEQARDTEQPRVRSRLGFLAMAAALSFLAAGIWGLARFPRVEARMSVARAPALSPILWQPHVLEGRVDAGGRVRTRGEALGEQSRLGAKDPAVVQLGLARVTMEGGTVLDWDGTRSSIHLEEGRVTLDVEHRTGHSFSVIMKDVRVDVVGTKFAVSLYEVSVTEGRVKVTLLADSSVRELGPGEKLSFGLGETASVEPSTPSVTAPVTTVNVSALLSRARSALGKGKVDLARAEVNRALAAKPTPSERAEAQTLLAECALVGGDSRSAQAGYARVAKENAGTPAGETAAYAAARLEKDPRRARGLLEGYLARYPQGRYRAEVQARLRSLPR